MYTHASSQLTIQLRGYSLTHSTQIWDSCETMVCTIFMVKIQAYFDVNFLWFCTIFSETDINLLLEILSGRAITMARLQVLKYADSVWSQFRKSACTH